MVLKALRNSGIRLGKSLHIALLLQQMAMCVNLNIIPMMNPNLDPVFKCSNRNRADRLRCQNVYAGRDGVSYPSNLSQLRDVVFAAIDARRMLCVVGAGMSQNGQNVGERGSMTVKLDKMNKVEVNPSTNTAVVTGNVTFSELEDAANEHGLAVKVRQASAIFGVLSSISTNVHGWDHKAGCMANTVNWVNVFDEKGNARKIRNGDPEFKECVGSFGTRYLMWQAEIQLTPNILLRREAESFDKVMDAVEHFKKNMDRADMALIMVGKKRFNTVLFYPESSAGAQSKYLLSEPSRGSYFERLMVDISRFLIWMRMKGAFDFMHGTFIEGVWRRPAVKLKNEFMNVNVNAIKKRFTGFASTHKFWLVEYFIEEKHLPAFFELYNELYKDAFVLDASIRYIPRFLNSRTAYAKTDVFSIVICWDQVLTDKEIRITQERNDKFLDFLRKQNGTFYLPYTNSGKDMAEFYKEFAMNLKKERRVFSNAMVEAMCSA